MFLLITNAPQALKEPKNKTVPLCNHAKNRRDWWLFLPWSMLYHGPPGGSAGKESACNAGDLGFIPGLGRSPGGGHGNPPQYSCQENPHGQWSPVDCTPWSPKKLSMSEWLTTTQHMLYYARIFIWGFLEMEKASSPTRIHQMELFQVLCGRWKRSLRQGS